jgi:hypothetical protein
MKGSLEKYLTKKGKLDYNLLYKDLADITGFNAEEHRGKIYKEVTDAYNGVTAPEAEVLLEQTDVVNHPWLLDDNYIIAYLNREAKSEFVKCQDEYSRYDAEDDRYIAEIKVRNKDYSDCLIEYEKFDNNIEYANETDKEFLYIVATNRDIYVFNVSRLLKDGYDFKWEWKSLHRNSQFGGYEDKIDKQVGYINSSKASVRYNYKP